MLILGRVVEILINFIQSLQPSFDIVVLKHSLSFGNAYRKLTQSNNIIDLSVSVEINRRHYFWNYRHVCV